MERKTLRKSSLRFASWRSVSVSLCHLNNVKFVVSVVPFIFEDRYVFTFTFRFLRRNYNPNLHAWECKCRYYAIVSSPSHNAASCQPRSQCPLRTLGTRLLPQLLSFAPPPNAAPNREEAEWARFFERWLRFTKRKWAKRANTCAPL